MHWITDGRFGEYCGQIAQLEDTNATISSLDASHEFFALSNEVVVCSDMLNWKLYKQVERQAAEHGAEWSFAALHKNYLALGPVMGKMTRLCIDCLQKRLTALPIGGGNSETEAALHRELYRNRKNLTAAFTPSTVRLAISMSVARFADPHSSDFQNISLVDQLGFAHSSAKISALHGCPICRPNNDNCTERFSVRIKNFFEGV